MVEIRALVVIIRRSLRSRFGRFAVGMGSEGRRRGLIRRRGGRYEGGQQSFRRARALIAPRVAAKRTLIKFYCARIKLTGSPPGPGLWSR